MKNIQKKRGFTIVELVIVIAVIAILAAVLIPTFSNVIARAKISADTQLCRNLNTVLTMATSEGRVPGSMYDVLYLVSESGYLLGNLNPTAEGYYYAWDSQGQKIVYIREDLDTVVYPEDYTIDKSKCWITVGDKEEAERVAAKGYNLYLEKNIDSIELHDVVVSIDTGAFKLGSLTVNGEAANQKDVILAGNFGTTTLDIKNASFSNTGTISTLNVGSNTASMSINGNVGSLSSSISSTTMSSTGAIGAITSGSVTAGSTTFTSTDAPTGGTGVTGSVANGGIVSIKDKEAIENIRTQIAGGRTFAGETVQLANDVNMAGIAFQPISNYSRDDVGTKYFQGTFDGQGHTIENFSTTGFSITGLNAGTNSSTPYFGASKTMYNEAVYGLFGSVKNTTIKNLNVTCAIDIVLDDANHYVGDSIGGIVGYAMGDFIVFENCTVSGYINGYDGVGGLLGRTKAARTEFINCTNNANVTGVRKTGAFVGSSYDANREVVYTNCVNNGNITCLGIEKDVELGCWGTINSVATLMSTRTDVFNATKNGTGYYTVSASNGEFASASQGTRAYKAGVCNKVTVDGFTNNGVIKLGDQVVSEDGTYIVDKVGTTTTYHKQ